MNKARVAEAARGIIQKRLFSLVEDLSVDIRSLDRGANGIWHSSPNDA